MRGREAAAAIPLLCYLSFGFWSMCQAFEISDCAKRLKKRDAYAGRSYLPVHFDPTLLLRNESLFPMNARERRKYKQSYLTSKKENHWSAIRDTHSAICFKNEEQSIKEYTYAHRQAPPRLSSSKVGKLISVNLDCDMTKNTCDLVPGMNATIAIDFTTERDVSKVTAVVHGIVMDVPIPFPLVNADACEATDSDIACPLNNGGSYHYKNTLLVHKSYPKVAVTVKWQLKDENDQDIVCALIPARIK